MVTQYKFKSHSSPTSYYAFSPKGSEIQSQTNHSSAAQSNGDINRPNKFIANKSVFVTNQSGVGNKLYHTVQFHAVIA